MTYDGDLQRSLDLLFYQDRSRDQLSSGDDDVLQIFSGDEKAARHGVLAFMDRHKNACWLVGERRPYLVVRVSGLFKDPEERVLKERYVKRQKRFREGRWPEQRPYRRNRK